MKKTLLVILVVFTCLLAADALAAEVKINEVNFPDWRFRDYVAEFDRDGNGALSEEEREAVKEIDVDKTSIESLDGIGYFNSLNKLSCKNCALTKLDLSRNKVLREVYCYGNKLTALDISTCKALEILWCNDNKLGTLNVSRNPCLKELVCSGNGLTKLDLSSNPRLERLSCWRNDLTALNVSANTALRDLDCGSNRLTALDLSKNTALKDLKCGSNQLKKLDLSKNTALTSLDCSGNKLTKLDLGKNTKLDSLTCDKNSLAKLDLSKNTKLTYLYCAGNKLTALDLSKNTLLGRLKCDGNRLTKLDLKKNTRLTYLYCDYNELTSLDLSKNNKLDYVSCWANARSVKAVGGRFDLSTLPGFNVKKASDWTNGTVKGTILTVTGSPVTYVYSAGQGKKITFTLNVKIVKAALGSVTLGKTKMAYTGEALTPSVTVKAKLNGTNVTLKEDVDYTVTYKNNVKAGKATVTVKGKGSFKGTITKTFTITPVKILKVTLDKTSFAYTGSACEPVPTVTTKVNGKLVTLKKGTDYTVKYENNVEKGTATVTVTGKGNYTGTIIKNFTIE